MSVRLKFGNFMKRVFGFVLLGMLWMGLRADASPLSYVGIKAGHSFGANDDVSLRDLYFLGRPSAPVYGLELDWNLYRSLSLQTNIESSEREWKRGNELGYHDYMGATIRYLSLPVLLQFTVKWSRLRFMALCGPRLDLSTTETSRRLGGGEYGISPKDHLFGASLGAGVRIDTWYRVMLTGSVRYEVDFTDFVDADWTKIEKDALNVWCGIGYRLKPE